MNVEIGTEAAQFPEKDYINGIFVAVWYITIVRHVTGTGSGLLGGIPRVVVQMSALTQKGPL